MGYKSFVMLLTVSFMLFGCSDQSNSNEHIDDIDAKETQTTEDSTPLTLENDGVDEEAFQEALAQFPDEIKDKIVTSSVPITEILDELGITPVGIPTTPYALPEGFEEIPEIGTNMAPDNEVITSLDAELFLGSESVKDSLDDHLKNISLDTAYLGTDRFDDIKMAVKVLGTYFEKEDKRDAMMEEILALENTLVKETEGLEKQKALLIIGMSDSFMVMNNNTYLGSILERTNIENVAETAFKSEETYAAINMENIIQANPDKIFVLAFGDQEKIKSDFMEKIEEKETWKSLNAYKNDNIQFLDYDMYGVSSMKNMEKAFTGLTDDIEAAGKDE